MLHLLILEHIAAAGKGNFVEDDKLKCYMKCISIELATVIQEFKK